MTYRVKEIIYTLQGEGAQAGRPSVFCRFSLCNLWTGREEDRHRAVCQFCDTDFVGTDGRGGGRFETAEALAGAVAAHWPGRNGARPMVVCTGGEPTLQLDQRLVRAFHRQGFAVAVETNGTRPVPVGCDWVCVSPKARAELVQRSGDELKLVFPQPGLPPEALQWLAFGRFFLQPMDGPDRVENTAAAVAYCLAYPQWHLSLQTHKMLGIP